VAASLQRGDRDARVEVVGERDVYDVGVDLAQHGVDVGETRYAPLRSGRLGPFGDDVAHGD